MGLFVFGAFLVAFSILSLVGFLDLAVVVLLLGVGLCICRYGCGGIARRVQI